MFRVPDVWVPGCGVSCCRNLSVAGSSGEIYMVEERQLRTDAMREGEARNQHEATRTLRVRSFVIVPVHTAGVSQCTPRAVP